jgi:hypothetical protein
MPRRGEAYEQFVYEKFKRLFVDSIVTLNDKIIGKESGLEREIDVSVRTNVADQELLYIVQCKDRAKRPADIVILGEFSAVIRDVGASKGFLICTSGFARSNHQYARTLGIELFTVEDINNERWNADIQIPFVYVKKEMAYVLDAAITANEALVEKNRGRPLTIYFDVSSLISFDGGKTSLTIQEHIENLLNVPDLKLEEGAPLDLLRPGLQVSVADVWVDCAELKVDLKVKRRIFLRYVTPNEYSQIRDHLNQTALPLHVAMSGTFPILDDSFVEVAGDEPPVLPGLFLQVEEGIPLERAHGQGPDA